MRKIILKQFIIVVLFFTFLVSFTACSSASVIEGTGKKSFDVILWNTNGDRFPAASGVDLIKFAAEKFKTETGIEVNLITIEANNQEDYFKKRIDVMLSKDQPEMILFSTQNQDELMVIESMKNELLPIDDFIENSNDILDGMKGSHYNAIATLVYGNVMNNALVSEFGYDTNTLFMSAEDAEALYLKWAETEGSELNLFDYRIFSELGTARMIHFEDQLVRLEHELIVEKIKKTGKFVAALPKRNLSKEDVNAFYTGSSKQIYNIDRDALLSTAHLRPVNFLTRVAFNAFDMKEFSANINETASGFVISDYSLVSTIGFGILDNQSKEQAHAIAFANFLLSQKFQMEMQSYTAKSPKMSGSILKSVNSEYVELARNQEMLQSGEPIDESVIEAYNLMVNRFNQPGAIHIGAVSSISRVAMEEILGLSIEQIWGEPKSDEVLLAELKKLEERLNLMVNE